MKLQTISSAGLVDYPVDAAADLLNQPDELVWLDVPSWDATAEQVLRDVFRFHPQAIRDCARRIQVPKLQSYADHVFMVLHAPQAGDAGHVHSIELDQFIGERYLVTVHGPVSAAADPAATRFEVDALERRLTAGELHPENAIELSYALATAAAERIQEFVAGMTATLWDLEYRFQSVVKAGPSSRLHDPEQFLDELFRARHGFVVARTQAAMAREVFARMHAIGAFGERGQRLIDDALDQFCHLAAMADVERENLQATIEFYQARTNTELTIAAERLAVIAAVTLPVTAVSSVLGMNLIVNDGTRPVSLVIAVASMIAMSALLLRWARRQGWW